MTTQRFLAIYSGMLTIVFAATVFCGFKAMRKARFETITVRRINIVEPDGTVRLTISNRADFPGGWVRGQEYPRPDRKDAAGMLFMSEEGTEQGGLIWGANQGPDGTIQNHSHLSFDQYEQNQIFALDAGREGDEKFSRITIADQGNYPIAQEREAFTRIAALPANQQDAAWETFFSTHAHDIKRLQIGRGEDGSVGLNLRDANGKTRIILSVGPDGIPLLQFLDSNGKVTNEMTAKR
jgi:hypothetical protein